MYRLKRKKRGMQNHGGQNHSRLPMILPPMILLLFFVGCSQRMDNQPRHEPLEASTFFADGMASRPLVAGTVARGHLQIDEAFYTGKVAGQHVSEFPLDSVAEKLKLTGDRPEITRLVLLRGKERFNIFCAVCHDEVGTGRGMVVQRGFPQPPSYHIERLREVPAGHMYDVITNGFGRMPDHAEQIPPADRWAIVAYVRALQLSQHADYAELADEDRRVLQPLKGGPP